MDKEEDNKIKEGDNLSAVAKEQGYRKLSLSPKKFQEITVRPVIIKDGKLLFDKTNKDHRYIVEGEQ
ncbi:MAG: hypothetical protein QMC95_13400 [Desulfitobacteriaceae bacterium]|nr:hypothetical protein [Desulfitobacteriaceae bacterium]